MYVYKNLSPEGAVGLIETTLCAGWFFVGAVYESGGGSGLALRV
jgi:hypothetical protein